MSELPDAVCGDCIAFAPAERDAEGKARGPCRFRPELGTIPEDLPACSSLKLRGVREGKVKAPARARVAGVGRRTAPRAAGGSGFSRRTLDDPATGETEGEITMDRNGLKQVLRELLEEETLYGYPEMGLRWQGGSLEIKPADASLQSKEVPLEAFFHKIVMLRDRLRVLEAKINGHEVLSEQDKVDIQAYISRCYGSLTTFNVLFADKKDQFRSK